MYTEENMEYNDNYEENNYEENNYAESNDNNGNSIWTLLLRILIIFVCLLLIIWIISKFVGGNNKKLNDGKVFNENIVALRLASEKYFFLENNLPKEENETITISLREMNNQKLIEEVRDYQDKACSTDDAESYVTIKKTSAAYELIIKLTCLEEQKTLTYYYDLKNYKCLSCNGNTHMDGSLVLDNEDEEKEDDSSDDEEQTEEEKLNINCNTWSDWTTLKLNDSRLSVRKRTMYKGYKVTAGGVNKIYGEWSPYTEMLVTPSDGVEVEIKQEVRTRWSENKITTTPIVNSDTIKIISTNTTGGGSSCSTSWKQVREEISASKYFEYLNKDLIIAVHDTYYKEECDDNCKTGYTKVYVVTYKKQVKSCSSTPSVTTYTYQELITETVNLYRYRTVTTQVVEGEKIYTENWVEKLPEGYIKTEEKTEYSYKDTSCKG